MDCFYEKRLEDLHLLHRKRTEKEHVIVQQGNKKTGSGKYI